MGVRSHEPYRYFAGIDPGSKAQERQHRQNRLSGGTAVLVFCYATHILGLALLVQFMNDAVRFDGGAHTRDSVI